MKFYDYIKKHWLAATVLLVLPLIAVATAWLLKADFKADAWLSYAGAVLAYYGTICLSAAALFQAERANKLSEKVLLQNQRAYNTNFAIDKVKEIEVHDCDYKEDASDETNVRTARLIFCSVLATPDSCQAFALTVTNYGEYPISKIIVINKYLVGRNDITETISKELNTIVAPHNSIEITVCNTPKFDYFRSRIIFIVTCVNVFGDEMTQQLEITGHGEKGTLSCVCSVTDNK